MAQKNLKFNHVKKMNHEMKLKLKCSQYKFLIQV